MANSNATRTQSPRPAFYLVDKPPAPAATSPPANAPSAASAADDAPDIPLEVRRRWMALLDEAVRRTGGLHIYFTDISVNEMRVIANQVVGSILINDNTIRK